MLRDITVSDPLDVPDTDDMLRDITVSDPLGVPDTDAIDDTEDVRLVVVLALV